MFEVDFCVGQEIRSQFHSTFVFLVFSPATFVGKIEAVFFSSEFLTSLEGKNKTSNYVGLCLSFTLIQSDCVWFLCRCHAAF